MVSITIRNRLRTPIRLDSSKGILDLHLSAIELEPNVEMDFRTQDEGEMTFSVLPNLKKTKNQPDIWLKWFTVNGRINYKVESKSSKLQIHIYRFQDSATFDIVVNSSISLPRVAVVGTLISLISILLSLFFLISSLNKTSSGKILITTPTSTASPIGTTTITPIVTAIGSNQQPINVYLTIPQQSQLSTDYSNTNFFAIISLVIAIIGLFIGGIQVFFQGRSNALTLKSIERQLEAEDRQIVTTTYNRDTHENSTIDSPTATKTQKDDATDQIRPSHL